MALKPSKPVVRAFPWRDGLATSGHKTSISETALWGAQNVQAEFDGLLSKRPGLEQWGQTIKKPDASDTGSTHTDYADLIAGLGGFIETDNSTGLITQVIQDGTLRTAVTAGSSNEDYLVSRSFTSAPATDTWSVRFLFNGINLPEYTPAGTVANTFAFRAIAAAGSGKEFAIWEGGIYYQQASDDTYVLIEGTEYVGSGGWYSVEVRCDASGDTEVYLNDVLIDTITSSLIKSVTPTTGTLYEFVWEVEGTTEQYNTKIADILYNNTAADPFSAVKIDDIESLQLRSATGSFNRTLIIAAGDYVYHDKNLEQAWRPVHRRQYANVCFIPYRNTIIWIDSSDAGASNGWQWNGADAPELLDNMPKCSFGTEHLQRLFVNDLDDPLRFHYSGSRQPNLWFTPDSGSVDEVDALFQAGYIPLPASRGDVLTAMVGDYFGLLVLLSRKGGWKMTGVGPQSFDVDTAGGANTGCESFRYVARINNDVWFGNQNGVYSLSTTDQYGEIQEATPSLAIQSLWGKTRNAPLVISKEYLHKARLQHNSNTGTVFMSVPLSGEMESGDVFVYNILTQSWVGPWSIASTAMRVVEVASPITEVTMFGGEDGRVGYLNPTSTYDFAEEAYDYQLDSATVNGRSIDPALVGLVKTFNRLRLFVLPRGDWNFTIEYWTDTDRTSGEITINQNVFKAHTLTEDFRLDIDPDGILGDTEEMGVIDLPVDSRGYGFNFVIRQSNAGEDIAIQGWELDLTVDGYERD